MHSSDAFDVIAVGFIVPDLQVSIYSPKAIPTHRCW